LPTTGPADDPPKAGRLRRLIVAGLWPKEPRPCGGQWSLRARLTESISRVAKAAVVEPPKPPPPPAPAK